MQQDGSLVHGDASCIELSRDACFVVQNGTFSEAGTVKLKSKSTLKIGNRGEHVCLLDRLRTIRVIRAVLCETPRQIMCMRHLALFC